mgnify:CR=1 FL=1
MISGGAKLDLLKLSILAKQNFDEKNYFWAKYTVLPFISLTILLTDRKQSGCQKNIIFFNY